MFFVITAVLTYNFAISTRIWNSFSTYIGWMMLHFEADRPLTIAAVFTVLLHRLESRWLCPVGLCWFIDQDQAAVGFSLLVALLYLAWCLLCLWWKHLGNDGLTRRVRWMHRPNWRVVEDVAVKWLVQYGCWMHVIATKTTTYSGHSGVPITVSVPTPQGKSLKVQDLESPRN